MNTTNAQLPVMMDRNNLVRGVILELRKISQALQYRPNDNTLRAFVEYLEDLAGQISLQIDSDTKDLIIAMSFTDIPEVGDDKTKDYRRVKARALSQAQSFAMKLFLQKPSDIVTKKHIEKLFAILQSAKTKRKEILKSYPAPPTLPELLIDLQDYYEEPQLVCYLEKPDLDHFKKVLRATKTKEDLLAAGRNEKKLQSTAHPGRKVDNEPKDGKVPAGTGEDGLNALRGSHTGQLSPIYNKATLLSSEESIASFQTPPEIVGHGVTSKSSDIPLSSLVPTIAVSRTEKARPTAAEEFDKVDDWESKDTSEILNGVEDLINVSELTEKAFGKNEVNEVIPVQRAMNIGDNLSSGLANTNDGSAIIPEISPIPRSAEIKNLETQIQFIVRNEKPYLIDEQDLSGLCPRIGTYIKDKREKGQRMVSLEKLLKLLSSGQDDFATPVCFDEFLMYANEVQDGQSTISIYDILEMDDLYEVMGFLLKFLEHGTPDINDSGPNLLRAVGLLADFLEVPACFKVQEVVRQPITAHILQMLKHVPEDYQGSSAKNPKASGADNASKGSDELQAASQSRAGRTNRKTKPGPTTSKSFSKSDKSNSKVEGEPKTTARNKTENGKPQQQISRKLRQPAQPKPSNHVSSATRDKKKQQQRSPLQNQRLTRLQAEGMGIKPKSRGQAIEEEPEPEADAIRWVPKYLMSLKPGQERLVIGRVPGCLWGFVLKPGPVQPSSYFRIDEGLLLGQSSLMRQNGVQMIDDLVARQDDNDKPTFRSITWPELLQFCSTCPRVSDAVKATLRDLFDMPNVMAAIQLWTYWIGHRDKYWAINTEHISKADALKVANLFGAKPAYIQALENAEEFDLDGTIRSPTAVIA